MSMNAERRIPVCPWLILLFAFFVNANTLLAEQEGDFAYTSDGTAVTITKYTGPGGPVSIPSTIAGLPVTGIGYAAFVSQTTLTSVTIPSSITTIADEAFAACTGLADVTIPSSVANIGSFAFGGCTGLNSVVLQEGITSIAYAGFSHCTNLSGITIPASVTDIGRGAFKDCTGLLAITAVEGNPAYKSMNGVLFNKSLTTLVQYPGGKAGHYTISASVSTIEGYAFSGCPELTGITIPPNVTDIRHTAFAGCTGLTSVTIPAGVATLGAFAFVGCTDLSSVIIEEGVTAIGASAFAGCESLAGLTIPASVTSIGERAFWLTGLHSVLFKGNAPTSFGNFVFVTNGRFRIYYQPGAVGFTSPLWKGYPAIEASPESHFTWTVEGSTIAILSYSGPGGHVVIPPQIAKLPVRTIRNTVFSHRTSLTGVIIPDSVISIGNGAFEYCSALAAVDMGNSVENLGNDVFKACTSLVQIDLPPSVTTVGQGVFWDCTQLFQITIPNAATIEIYMFRDCTSLTTVNMGDGVRTIRSWAFQGCGNIIQVNVPDGVTWIQDEAFIDCTKLSAVMIGEDVFSIEDNAFARCPALLHIYVGANNYTFADEDGVLLDHGHHVLKQYPQGRSGSYTVPKGVTHIRNAAFRDCSLLDRVTLPTSVTSIGDYAFSGCTGLTGATFPGNAPSIFGSGVFTNAAPDFTVYYYESSSGFTSPTWNGYPAVMLAFSTWPVLSNLPSDKRGPGDRNGPLDLPNLLAYAMALDPLEAVASDMPALDWLDSTNGRASFRYRRAKISPGVSLVPKISSNLNAWEPAEILDSGVIDNGDWEIVIIDVAAPTEGSLYFRVDAVKP